jgi:hypothetical protein
MTGAAVSTISPDALAGVRTRGGDVPADTRTRNSSELAERQGELPDDSAPLLAGD